jgi:hypothetical protein
MVCGHGLGINFKGNILGWYLSLKLKDNFWV